MVQIHLKIGNCDLENISWHMTFRAHFHNTGVSYHDHQFPMKNG